MGVSSFHILGTQPANARQRIPGIKPRIALVSMPWSSVRKPSIALPLLKSYVQNAGFAVDLHYLNIQFGAQIGLDLYENFAGKSLHPELFFSQALFGTRGMGTVKNDWENISASEFGRAFLSVLMKDLDAPEAIYKRLPREVDRFIERQLREVDWSAYLAVGFTTTFAQTLASSLLAKYIKAAYPAVKTIFGGANVDSVMGVELMKVMPWIDYVAHGEAEVSLPQLLVNISESNPYQKVPGISMRRDLEVVRGDLDQRPFIDISQAPAPDYSDYIDQLVREGVKAGNELVLFFESSRGCWWGSKHHCTFCGLNATGMTYRKKDAAKVLSELLFMSEKYRCFSFSATDNILPQEYFSQFVQPLASENIDLSLFYEVKANLSRLQLLQLSNAGIRDLQPGIESFNSRLLKLMQKGIKAIQNIQLLRWCSEFGVTPHYNILYGFPGENATDYADYPDLFLSLSHLQPPGALAPVLFERFSPYHFNAKQFGLELRPLSGYEFVFPREEIAMENLAYFFEGEWEGQPVRFSDYINEVEVTWRKWQKLWSLKHTFCFYLRGPKYITIFDNRPLTLNDHGTARKITLEEPLASAYLFCDENRSFRAIVEHVASSDDALLRTMLDQLVRKRLMFREDDRYLSLAVRKPRAGHSR